MWIKCQGNGAGWIRPMNKIPDPDTELTGFGKPDPDPTREIQFGFWSNQIKFTLHSKYIRSPCIPKG